MPRIAPRIQNFSSFFLGGDPYSYASVGANDSITLPLKTSFFLISNEEQSSIGAPNDPNFVAEVNGNLKVNIPNAKTLGTEIILYLQGADGDNQILVSFTGLDANSDEFSLTTSTSRDFPVVLNLVWMGTAWVLRNGGSIVSATVS
jgi:hypothetical protein